MPSSGQFVENAVRWVECAECECAECRIEEDDNTCSFAGAEGVWIDPELNAWGWKCEAPYGCGREHQHDTLDGLPGF